MDSDLPATGTAQLLEVLSPYVPDDFIDERWPAGRTGGRRRICSSAQLFRTHLLSLLTPAHSLNLLVQMLPEQPTWRKFAQIRSSVRTPDVRMLHEFRSRVGVCGMRAINQHLLEPLIETYAPAERSLALIDATDLPAACSGFKKKHGHLFRGASGTWRTHAQDRAKPLVCRLQEAHAAPLAASL